MESPLSFNSSENFRKKLLVRNLPPYKVDNAFSQDGKPGSSEFNINDLTPIDSPSVEQIGNQQEKALLPINQYGPKNSNNDFGDMVPINDNQNYKTNEGEYGYPDTIGSDLENIGNNSEKQLIIKNVYRPQNGLSDFGSTAWYINNDKVINTVGEGEYTIQDTVGSNLETTANADRPVLITNNQYGPQVLSNTLVPINNNLQTNANEGEYGFPDTLNSPLENEGSIDRPVLIAINQYGPNNLPNLEVQINQNLQTNSNEGEYGYPDTVRSPLEEVGKQERKPTFLENPWGPEDNQSTDEVEPYRKLKNLTIQQGNYDVTDADGSVLEVVGGVKETEAYIGNKYATGLGEYDPTVFKYLQQKGLQLPYANSDNTFIFLPSTYTPYSILLNDNPSGSDGSLSQDSDLANIGAKSLNKEFKARVALELFQQTLGQVNIFNSSVNPLTGEISASPNTDPFDAIGLLTGNIPLVSRVYNITSPDFLFGRGINFAAKLAGLYSPYSYIPGEYFDYPNPVGNPTLPNNLSTQGGALGALFSLLQPANQSSSELFLEHTSNPTRKLLYNQLNYNQYRPEYKVGTELFYSQGVFYIGDRKNHITELVSPADELPQGKTENSSSVGPVLSYSDIGKKYEGVQLNETQFGLNSRNLYSAGANKDGVKWIGAGIFGGVTWVGSSDNGPQPGKLQGRGNKQFEDNSEFTFGNLVGFDSTKSTEFGFTPGSLLDVTQKLVNAGQKSKTPLEHVGNAINQVSKVFNDGYQELTKGSRVVRYTTANSLPSSTTATGLEYCRVFTKDRPYYTYDELQKRDGNIRGYDTSVLDNTWNLNIAPVDGYSIKDGKVKKYMFSLENLAWRTSNKKGFTYDDLPACEKGPNGGRIMWFPPYDLTFDESISTGWQDNTFLGRTEPIYTYTNTSRKGNLSFKIIVDHPSILNLLVKKEMDKSNATDSNEITQIIDSFFAGCTKYDLWDLTSKFPMFTPNDIFEAQILTTEDIITVVEENNYSFYEEEVDINIDPEPTPTPQPCMVLKYNVGVATDLTYTACSGNQVTLTGLNPGDTGEICVIKSDAHNFSTPDPTNTVTPTGENCVQTTPGPGPSPTPTPTPPPTEPPLDITFPDIGFYFDNNYPTGVDTNEITVTQDFQHWYDLYIASKTNYTDTGISGKYSAALNKIFSYGDANKVDKTSFVTGTGLNDNAKIKYLSDFVETRKDKISEFFSYITKEFDEAKNFVKKIGPMLEAGDTISFELIASASAVTNVEYNKKLSKRRFDTVEKWFLKQSSPNGTLFSKYKTDGILIITPQTLGEETTLIDEPYKFINCTKDFIDKKKEGTVSVNAMACRRTKVSKITRTKNNSQNENQPQDSTTPLTNGGDSSQTGQEFAGQDFTIIGQPSLDATSSTTGQPNLSTKPFVNQGPISQPYTNSPNTREQDVQTQQFEKRKDLTKRLARKLLTECNYFEYIKQNEPMVYDGIKSKIKYFQPAFHSITPEGLNARLVFLQQCMRPGDTIPTVSNTDNGQQTLLFNDVTNSAFGAPPICVLRIGDFFHTKIAIDSISFKYDDGRFDLNPEGIGVQPMIVNVNVGFSFIGGHGLAGPVAKLQNALSFNYYANTEMYDERAEDTSKINLDKYDAQILEQVKETLNIVNTEAPRPVVNDGGVTIGTTLTNTIDLTTTVTSGTIVYKDNMKKLSEDTKNYTEKTLQILEKVNENYLIGGLQILCKDRKYVEGNFNYFGGDLTHKANIFGYSYSVQDKMDSIANKAKEDVDTDNCPLLNGIANENLKDSDIRKVKKELKKQIDDAKNKMLNDLQNYVNELNNIQYPLISSIDKMSYVSDAHDGYIKKNNTVVVYNLSGTTNTTPPLIAGVTNTLQELVEDSYLVQEDINNFYDKLKEFNMIPTGDSEYSKNFTQNTFISNKNMLPNETVFFILFGKKIIDDPNQFAIDLIDKANPNMNQDEEIAWLQFLDKNLNTENTGLSNSYKSSKNTIDAKIKEFKAEYFNRVFTIYKPYNLDKERKMWYESQVPAQTPYNDNLSELYSSKSAGWDRFNLQKSFK